jgi:hypothetical protein
MSIPVRVVSKRGRSVVVETELDGKGIRVVLPKSKVKDGKVEEEEFEKGVPYGADWESLIEITVTPEEIARELRKQDIWTLKEYKENVNRVVRRIFARAFMRDVMRVVRGGK